MNPEPTPPSRGVSVAQGVFAALVAASFFALVFGTFNDAPPAVVAEAPVLWSTDP